MTNSKNTLPFEYTSFLKFKDNTLEKHYTNYYDKSVRIPLRHGIILSLVSWYSAIGLIYYVIPEKSNWLVPLTLIYIGSYFIFLIYATYSIKYKGYFHILGAISNAWAGLYAIFMCIEFPGGVHYVLPVLIFIMFFGSYFIRLRWIAGFISATTYLLTYQFYLIFNSPLDTGQVVFYSFVSWMTLVFAILAGRSSELSSRTKFIQTKTIQNQNKIILKEKEFLLKEVHHRVKNNLQIIISLIKIQLRDNSKKNIDLELKYIQSRVLSISTAHKWINKKNNFSSIQLKPFIHGIIDNFKSLYFISEQNSKIEILEEMEIDINRAISFGLIINEVLILNYRVNNNESLNFNLIIDKHLDDAIVTFKDYSRTPIEHFINGVELIKSLSEQIDADFNISFDNGNEIKLCFALEEIESIV